MKPVNFAKTGQCRRIFWIDTQCVSIRFLCHSVLASCCVQVAQGGINDIEIRIQIQRHRTSLFCRFDVRCIIGMYVCLHMHVTLAGVRSSVTGVDLEGLVEPAEGLVNPSPDIGLAGCLDSSSVKNIDIDIRISLSGNKRSVSVGRQHHSQVCNHELRDFVAHVEIVI